MLPQERPVKKNNSPPSPFSTIYYNQKFKAETPGLSASWCSGVHCPQHQLASHNYQDQDCHLSPSTAEAENLPPWNSTAVALEIWGDNKGMMVNNHLLIWGWAGLSTWKLMPGKLLYFWGLGLFSELLLIVSRRVTSGGGWFTNHSQKYCVSFFLAAHLRHVLGV